MSKNKKCTKCDNFYPLGHFRKVTGIEFGSIPDLPEELYYKSTCKACRRQLRLEKKGREKAKRMCRTYGVEQEFMDIVKGANTECQICGSTHKLVYDHCHDIGEGEKAYRGIICNKCNSGIGLLGDKPLNVMKAWLYLEKFYNKKGDDLEESTY